VTADWHKICKYSQSPVSWLILWIFIDIVFATPPFFTPQSRVLEKFPAFYGTRRFSTSFTSARHLSLSWATSIQSKPSHPTSWRSILILSSRLRLGLPSGLFSSGFPTKTLYTPLPSSYVVHAPPISFFSIWSSEQYWVRRADHLGPHYIVFSTLLPRPF